jgi:hypothetical protein
VDGCISGTYAIRVKGAVLARSPVLHRLWVVSRRLFLAVVLALLVRQHLTNCHALNTAQRFHYSPLNALSIWASVIVNQQHAYRRATDSNTERCLSTVANADFCGKKPYKQWRLFTPTRKINLIHSANSS